MTVTATTTTETAAEADTTSTLVRKVSTLVNATKTFSVADLLGTVAETRREKKGEPVKVGRDTPLPKATYLGLPKELAEKVAEVNAMLADLELPTEHRRLAKPELRAVQRAWQPVDALAKAYAEALASMKVAVNNHINIGLEDSGQVTDHTQTDVHGNWALKADTGADLPDESLRFTRGYKKPQLGIDPDKLLALKNEGKISTAIYNKVTRPARLVDEHGFNSVIARDPSMIDILGEAIVETSAPQVPLSLTRNTTKGAEKK